jgi:hypothetical protein
MGRAMGRGTIWTVVLAVACGGGGDEGRPDAQPPADAWAADAGEPEPPDAVSLPSHFELAVLSVQIPSTKPAGTCWDYENERCADPDPIAVMTIGDVTFTTSVATDTFYAEWPDETVAVEIIGEAVPVQIELRDDDGPDRVADPIDTCVVLLDPALRPMALTCSGATTTVNLSVMGR